jgi:cysteine desulfurase/selenocysteine lyase
MGHAPDYSGRRAFLSLCAGAAVLPALSFESTQGQAVRAPSWRASFPALSQQVEGRPLAYLDSAATTLRPQAVIDALVNFYSTDNANPSPVHTLASRAANRLGAARATVAKFLNAPNPNEVIFTRGTSEGMNLLAGTFGAAQLRAGDEIILTVAEHSSNLMPWTRAARQAGAQVRVVDVDEEGRLRLDQLKQMLSTRTKLVAFSHVSNVLGLINPAKEICALVRPTGARVIIDGAQSVPHTKVDVQDLGCDFYVFSGHKVLGPMATGVVWGRLELLDEMPPYHVGSNMAHEVDFERASFEHGAQKFQAGTPDVAGPVGLAAAIDYLVASGPDAAWRHDQELVRHGLARLGGIKGLRLIGPRTADNRVPVFTFVVNGRSPMAVARALNQRGIAIRAGDMAALPLLRRFGVSEAARASAYLYSTTADIDRLADGLASIV